MANEKNQGVKDNLTVVPDTTKPPEEPKDSTGGAEVSAIRRDIRDSMGENEIAREYPDEELAILWLSERDVKKLYGWTEVDMNKRWIMPDEQPPSDEPIADLEILPDYIKGQIDSLHGRNPRGRLWVPGQIKFDQLRCDIDNDPRMEQIADRGGIVFLRSDLAKVKQIIEGQKVGFLTDVSLGRI